MVDTATNASLSTITGTANPQEIEIKHKRHLYLTINTYRQPDGTFIKVYIFPDKTKMPYNKNSTPRMLTMESFYKEVYYQKKASITFRNYKTTMINKYNKPTGTIILHVPHIIKYGIVEGSDNIRIACRSELGIPAEIDIPIYIVYIHMEFAIGEHITTKTPQWNDISHTIDYEFKKVGIYHNDLTNLSNIFKHDNTITVIDFGEADNKQHPHQNPFIGGSRKRIRSRRKLLYYIHL